MKDGAGKLLPFRARARHKPITLDEAPAGARIDQLSDEALVAACATGDTAALAALFDRHHAMMFRFVSRIASAAASDVEDLVQTAFLEVWRSAGRFRAQGSARSWMLGVAANLVRHYVRGEVRRRSAMAGFAEVPVAGADRPDEMASRQQLIDRLADAVAALPHDLRVAFVLCDVEEVPGVDAARVLGVRQGTMWRRLHDARKRLRDVLAGGAAGGSTP